MAWHLRILAPGRKCGYPEVLRVLFSRFLARHARNGRWQATKTNSTKVRTSATVKGRQSGTVVPIPVLAPGARADLKTRDPKRHPISVLSTLGARSQETACDSCGALFKVAPIQPFNRCVDLKLAPKWLSRFDVGPGLGLIVISLPFGATVGRD